MGYVESGYWLDGYDATEIISVDTCSLTTETYWLDIYNTADKTYTTYVDAYAGSSTADWENTAAVVGAPDFSVAYAENFNGLTSIIVRFPGITTTGGIAVIPYEATVTYRARGVPQPSGITYGVGANLSNLGMFSDHKGPGTNLTSILADYEVTWTNDDFGAPSSRGDLSAVVNNNVFSQTQFAHNGEGIVDSRVEFDSAQLEVKYLEYSGFGSGLYIVGSASINTTTHDVVVNAKEVISVDAASVTTTAFDAGVFVGYIFIDSMEVNATTFDASVKVNAWVRPDTTSVTTQTYPIKLIDIVKPNTAAVTATTYPVNVAETIEVDAATAQVTTYDANVSEIIRVDATQVTATTFDTLVAVVEFIEVDTLTVAVTTQEVEIDFDVTVDTASVTVTTYPVLILTQVIEIENTLQVTTTTFDVTFNEEEIVFADTAQITAATNDINLNAREGIVIDAAAVTVTAYDPTTNAIEIVEVDTLQAQVTTEEAALNASVIPQIVHSSFTTNNANVIERIVIDTATVSTSTYDANINVFIAPAIAPVAITTAPVNVIERIVIDTASITTTAYDANVNENIVVGTAVTTETYNANIIESIVIDTATVAATANNANVIERIVIDTASIAIETYNTNVIERIVIDAKQTTFATQDAIINARTFIQLATEQSVLVATLDPTYLFTTDFLILEAYQSNWRIDDGVAIQDRQFIGTGELYTTYRSFEEGSSDAVIGECEEAPVQTSEWIQEEPQTAEWLQPEPQTAEWLQPYEVFIAQFIEIDTASINITANDLLIDDVNAVLVDNVAAVSTATYDITFAEQSEIIEVGTSTAMMDLLEVSTKADEGITIDLATTAANTLGITLNEEEVIAIDAAAIQAITQAIELIEGSAVITRLGHTTGSGDTSQFSIPWTVPVGDSRIVLAIVCSARTGAFGTPASRIPRLNGVDGTLLYSSTRSARHEAFYWLESQIPAGATSIFFPTTTFGQYIWNVCVTAYSNIDQINPLLTTEVGTYSTTSAGGFTIQEANVPGESLIIQSYGAVAGGSFSLAGTTPRTRFYARTVSGGSFGLGPNLHIIDSTTTQPTSTSSTNQTENELQNLYETYGDWNVTGRYQFNATGVRRYVALKAA